MGLTLPAAAKAVLDQYDASKAGFHEHDLAAAIAKGVGPADILLDAERPAVSAEVSAFNFMPSTRPEGSIWETYFAPSMSATLQDGTEVHSPDIKKIDGPIIIYWAKRSGETNHPIMRARYADLVWDLSRTVTGNRAAITHAQHAIDAYIDVIDKKVYFNEVQAEDFVKRALDLAIRINDKSRIHKAKEAIFDLYSLVGDIEQRGLWWLLFDNLYALKKVNLSDREQQTIVDELERVLRLTSDQANAERFDPFAAQGAAERLERHYRRIGQPGEVHRVIHAYGQAFEYAANEANPLLAVAWLQPVFEKYQDVGLKEDAARLHQILETRGPQAQANMQRVEVSAQFTMEDIEKYAEALTAGDQKQALGQIGVRFIPRVADVQALNEQMRSHAPLSTLIPIRRFEAGHVAAIIGPQAEDRDGRLIHEIANRIGLEMPWLAVAFDKLKARYGLDTDQIWAVLAGSPLFEEDQRAIVVDGLAAWLRGDHIKAIHVLVPQVERALRNLAGLIGVPITGRGHTKGTMQIRGLGEILYDALFTRLVDGNVRQYLLAFLADQRGINLRNRVAHGLLDHAQMHHGLADRLVQVLLALSCLQPEVGEEQSAAGSS